jgi:hypothetical protein
MRLDWHNDLACGRFVFDTRKLAKRHSTLNIGQTKPVPDSAQSCRLDIERNLKEISQYSEALTPLQGDRLCCDRVGKKELAQNL